MAAIRSRASRSLAAILTIVALGLTASPGMGQPEAPPSFASIVAAVAPAVVTITAVLEPESASGYPDPGDEMAEEDATLGSGVIIDPRGVVVTNAHVAGGARPIEIVTDNGRRFRPTRIAIDRPC